jgi:hypothetical protein
VTGAQGKYRRAPVPAISAQFYSTKETKDQSWSRRGNQQGPMPKPSVIIMGRTRDFRQRTGLVALRAVDHRRLGVGALTDVRQHTIAAVPRSSSSLLHVPVALCAVGVPIATPPQHRCKEGGCIISSSLKVLRAHFNSLPLPALLLDIVPGFCLLPFSLAL